VPNEASGVLKFECPKCTKRLKAPEKLSGKKLSCPHCGASILVPGVIKSVAMEDDWLELDQPSVAKEPVLEDAYRNEDAPPNLDPELNLEPVSKNQVPKQSLKGTENKKVSIFDDDLPDLAPIDFPEPESAPAATAPNVKPSSKAPAAKPPQANSAPSILDSLDDDIPLAPLVPPKKGAGQKTLTSSALEDLMLESEALIKTSDLDVGDEFSFKCKVCGTTLYVRESQIGTLARCPDCYSESVVPKPTVKPKKIGNVRVRENADVALAPVDAKSIRDPKGSKAESELILERAKVEIDKEKEDLDGIQGSFDSKRWIALIFWFLQDPSIIIVSIVLSGVCAIWMAAVGWIPQALELEGTGASMARAAVFFIPFIPLVGACLLLGLSIFMMVANQLKRIDDWPFNRIGDSLGELFMFLSAMAIASIPGGMIGLPLNSLFGGILGTVACSFVSIWILFPFFFLSMANNNRITEPFSRVVFDSLKGRADAWGAMYLQTMLVFAGFFVIINLAMQPGLTGEIILGLSLPMFIFFCMNQYGLLAGRLSDITELGFEGDFSQDNEDE
jgi:DNA-directed RNA polymerase subunit RPC12/RpoP